MTEKFTIDFLFDLGSPYSYLAHTQLQKFEQKNNVVINLQPILLGGLFKLTDNKSPFYIASQAKKRYLLNDIKAWANLYKVAFNFPTIFPANTLKAMRGALVAKRMGVLSTYIENMFHAYFVEDKDISDIKIITDVVSKIGADMKEFTALIVHDSIKKELFENTQKAHEIGAFGVPTFSFDNHLFFGNDRFALLEQAIEQSLKQCKN